MKPVAHHLGQGRLAARPGVAQTTLWLVLGLGAALLVRQSESATSLTPQEFLLMRVQIKNFLIVGGLVALSVALTSTARRPSWLNNTPLASLTPSLLSTTLTGIAGVAFALQAVDALFLATLFSVQFVGHFFTNWTWKRRCSQSALHVVIVGTSDRALELASEVESDPADNYNVLGFVDELWSSQEILDIMGHEMISDYKDFAEYLKENVVDVVFFSLPPEQIHSRTIRLVEHCEQQGLGVVFDTQSIYPSFRPTHVGACFRGNGISLAPNVGRGVTWAIKRTADFVLSALALAVLAIPFALIAIAIKLDSPGPAFFKQVRIGFNKRRFPLYKFRTMVEDAEALQADLEAHNEVDGAAFKMREDPRITRVGRFLREWSIDELPEFWNVLIGDMSLVGPRPLPLRDYANFSDLRHCRRQSVPPGLTCLWQVRGRSNLSYEEWMQMDLEYIDRWSLWLDIQLILRTVPAVLLKRGAY